MRSEPRAQLALVALVAVALAASPLLAISSATHAPRVVSAPAGLAGPAGAAPAASHSVALTSPAPAAPRPQTCSAPTPQNPPHWNSLAFFDDVEVSFYVPGSPSLDGGGFNTGLCTNNLPTHLNGFYINVTTNVAMINAILTVWGTQWPNGTTVQPIKGFDPLAPTNLSAFIPNGPRTTATFYVDLYRWFLPGSTVYFNMTVESAAATPSTIYSSQQYHYPYNDSGLIDNFTWAFYVEPPWASTTFASDIAISTSPDVLSNPVYDPNRNQPLQIFLKSISSINGTIEPIPKAFLYLNETSHNITNNYGETFAPLNSTVTNVTIPPAPGARATFHIIAWLPWKGGQIDPIMSLYYAFNWTSNGGWWYPSLGLVRNAEISTSPNVLAPVGTKTTLAEGTAVNVTIHEQTQNITFGAAEVHAFYSDSAGSTDAVLPMTPEGPNTSFALIPGLPSGGTVAFYIIAKDIFGTPIASGNWTYTESGIPQAGPGGFTLPTGYGLFFFEATDLSTGHLVPYLNFTLSNESWSETRVGTALGFGAPEPLAGTGYLAVTWGTYVVTVHAFGQTQSATVTVSSTTPFDIVFYVASGPVSQTSWVQETTLTIPAVIGLAGACLAAWPVSAWFRERRRKAEQEQRRITL